VRTVGEKGRGMCRWGDGNSPAIRKKGIDSLRKRAGGNQKRGRTLVGKQGDFALLPALSVVPKKGTLPGGRKMNPWRERRLLVPNIKEGKQKNNYSVTRLAVLRQWFQFKN